MTDSEARRTFDRLTMGEGTTFAQPKVNELIRLLGNLPLAVAQAAAFIGQTGSSLEEYISIFNSECDRETLLAIELQSPNMPPRSVVGTLAITVERIEREHPLAIKLLELMSLLDCLSIPKSLLRGLPWQELETEVTFAKTIGVLLNFSLVGQPNHHEYRLHGLVALSIRARMQPKIYSTRVTDAVELVESKFPEGTFENITQCTLLLPHAISIATKAEIIHQLSTTLINLEIKMVQHLYGRGLFTEASSYADKSFRFAEILGLTDLTRIQELLGQSLAAQGKYNDALEWHSRALAGREKALGSDHPDTLATVNNMAIVFRSQGKYDDALEWYSRALAGMEKALGSDHPRTLATAEDIARATKSKEENTLPINSSHRDPPPIFRDTSPPTRFRAISKYMYFPVVKYICPPLTIQRQKKRYEKPLDGNRTTRSLVVGRRYQSKRVHICIYPHP